LSGLTRVRQFQQDDCHIYLREDQLESEVKRLTDFIHSYYALFGLKANLRFATRPPQRIGTDAMWDQAEGALERALQATGLPYALQPGDGAFYGPKIDFEVADSLGRKWQLGTIQLDYAQAERFGLEYVGEDNAPHRPVVIHRAVMGSFERFFAILIEHNAGAFPLWLAPEQIRVLPITDRVNAYGESVRKACSAAGLRAKLDERSEKIGAKIRDAQLQKIPVMLVVGDREAEQGTVAVRSRKNGTKGPCRFRPSSSARKRSTRTRARSSDGERRDDAQAEDPSGRREALQEDATGKIKRSKAYKSHIHDQEDDQAEARSRHALDGLQGRSEARRGDAAVRPLGPPAEPASRRPAFRRVRHPSRGVNDASRQEREQAPSQEEEDPSPREGLLSREIQALPHRQAAGRALAHLRDARPARAQGRL
jgi:hypothetical protein